MAQNERRQRNTFRKFEKLFTRVILGTLLVLLLMLVSAAVGIGWLKWILALTVLLVSGLGGAVLVLKQEHRRLRSRWMLCAFAAFILCTLVSLIVGFPAPGA